MCCGCPSPDFVSQSFSEWWSEAQKYARTVWEFVLVPPDEDGEGEDTILYNECLDFDTWWAVKGPKDGFSDESLSALKMATHAAWDAALASVL